MAGSYKHIVDSDNSFIGVDLIEDLGDAHEALEECYEMILYLTGGDKHKILEAYREGYFKKHCPPENDKFNTFDQFWEEG